MKRIKLTFPYPDWPLIKQFPNNTPKWGNYDFDINPAFSSELHYDYHFVYDFLLNDSEKTMVRDDNTFLITGEPESIQKYAPDYLSQFKGIITSHPSLIHSNKIFHPLGLPWHIGKSYDELIDQNEIEKPKKICFLTSNKSFTKGHRERLTFLEKVKSKFKDKIDILGRGFSPFNSKWDILSKYKYSIVIENSVYPFYFTEKITDCYLALTFPIYYGAPNIADFFDPESFLWLNSLQSTSSLCLIEKLLDDTTHYDKVKSSLHKQKNKVLNKYNLFPLIIHFIEKNTNSSGLKVVESRLQNLNMFPEQNLLTKFKSLWAQF
jgi:hypothetical protein